MKHFTEVGKSSHLHSNVFSFSQVVEVQPRSRRDPLDEVSDLGDRGFVFNYLLKIKFSKISNLYLVDTLILIV